MEATAKAFYAGHEHVGIILARFSDQEGGYWAVMESEGGYLVLLPEFLIEAL